MAATRLQEVQRRYFVRKNGGGENTQKSDAIRRQWMMKTVGATVNPRTPMHQLEKLWLMSVINGAGGTVRDFKSMEELWRNAVAAIGQVPVKSLADNKIKFYLSAP